MIRIDHLGLACADVEAAAAFYADVFAAAIERAPGHPVLVVAGALRLALTPRGPDELAACARGEHLALDVSPDELKRIAARLEARGAPTEAVRGRLYFADPDGAVIELIEG